MSLGGAPQVPGGGYSATVSRHTAGAGKCMSGVCRRMRGCVKKLYMAETLGPLRGNLKLRGSADSSLSGWGWRLRGPPKALCWSLTCVALQIQHQTAFSSFCKALPVTSLTLVAPMEGSPLPSLLTTCPPRQGDSLRRHAGFTAAVCLYGGPYFGCSSN